MICPATSSFDINSPITRRTLSPLMHRFQSVDHLLQETRAILCGDRQERAGASWSTRRSRVELRRCPAVTP